MVALYPVFQGILFSKPVWVAMEITMEKEEMKNLTEEELQERISRSLSAMKGVDPEELERVKGIIRKNVPFFTRSAFAAYLLIAGENGRKASPERKGERKMKAEKESVQERAKAEPKPERIIPEGAKTIYINVGKMKHLYAKDLSKLLQGVLGITRDDIYMIRIHDKYSFVTMSEENCQKAIEKVSGMDINGRTASVSFAEKKGGKEGQN